MDATDPTDIDETELRDRDRLNDTKLSEEGATSSIDSTWTDENIECLIEAYQPFLQDVKVAHLVPFMPGIFSRNETRDIVKLDKNRSSSEASEEFFKILLKKEERGKWQALLDALEVADYPYIAAILKGKPPKENHYMYGKIIHLFAPKIQNEINPMELIPHLLSKGVINQRDREEIESFQRSNGQMAAAMILLSSITSRIEDWYEKFLDSLSLCKYEHLVKEIDPAYAKKKEFQQNATCASGSFMLSSYSYGEKENFAEDYGSGIASVNNLSAASLSPPPVSGGGPPQNLQQLTSALNKIALVEPSLPNVASGANNGNTLVPSGPNKDATHLKRLAMEMDSDVTCQSMDQNSCVGTDHNLENSDTEKVGPKMLNLEPNILCNGQVDETVETEDTDDSDIPVNIEPFELRSYQAELAEPGLAGRNVIICAPTGSGKTHVALQIIQEHINLGKGRRISRVVFLVGQVALADQQAKLCRKHLPYRTQAISGDSQRKEKVPLSEMLKKCDILVMTAQILLDALVNKEIDSILSFSLMVFDECHHTHTKHPFNQIMNSYMDLKFSDKIDRQTLPQIVGLTASVGVGKAKTDQTAVNWIQTLMANLDVGELCTVQKNSEELSEFVSIPQEDLITVPGRAGDLFGDAVNQIMATIEKKMFSSKHVPFITEVRDFQAVLKPPAQRGGEQYTQWVSRLWKETAKIHDQAVRRFFISCRTHLEWYNNALIIYGDARITDALAHLNKEYKTWLESTIMDETDRLLREIFDNSKPLLDNCKDDYFPNPKLEKLKHLIVSVYKDKPDSRGMVFVKTRNLVDAIFRWMKETPSLSSLSPAKFVGAQAASDKGGMTKPEQVDILDLFKKGDHKLIIATSVAEEGLDISKCNLVIRYDHVTNEIAMVQSRGRGRAEDSIYAVVAEQGKGTAEKEEINIIREAMMYRAIRILQASIGQDRRKFLEELEKRQQNDMTVRALEAFHRKGRSMRDGEFELRCFKCDNFACMSSDIKKIQNAHHAVVDDDFKKDRVRIARMPNPRFIDESIQTVAKVYCKSCGYDLGNITLHKQVEFPVIKIASFLIVDGMGNKTTVKKWKSVPFQVGELTDEYLRMKMQGMNPHLVTN